MAKGPVPLIAGNWKMNGLRKGAEAEIRKLARLALKPKKLNCELVVCPPATLLLAMQGWLRAARADRRIALGGQDCHAATSGAHTGDISAQMLKDAGASHVILGHSERRQNHGETDAAVAAKAAAAHAAKLVAIVCVGETLAEREEGQAEAVVARQIAGSLPEGSRAGNTVIAYEPVWAIGTGRTPAPVDVARMHDRIRAILCERFRDGEMFRILYGGSVKPGNAPDLLRIANVDGALVGGASLVAADFWGIARVRA
ncbi:MAG: triose-phosphate isomerase [Alphaproteobacteria bacterium]|nr:triose-phosphate isomerase [Alphaproteobacteria bacterium]